MEVKDIAASVSASLSNSEQTTFTNHFGNVVRNLGSGTLSARFDETTTTDTQNAADAKAVSATAKTGDGGYADATATMQSEGGALSGSGGAGAAGLPSWLPYAALGLGVLGMLGLGGLFIMKKK
jgi:hypothetical protein